MLLAVRRTSLVGETKSQRWKLLEETLAAERELNACTLLLVGANLQESKTEDAIFERRTRDRR